MTTKIKDWTGYKLVWESFGLRNREESVSVLRQQRPKLYVVEWKGGAGGILSIEDLEYFAKDSKVIPPKRVIIQKFFAGE